jgi:chromosome segregation ATPase
MKFFTFLIIYFSITILLTPTIEAAKSKLKLKSKSSSRTKTQSEANFIFSNKNSISKFRDSLNNFHGNVGIDTENKGIIISTFENENNDKMLRLISEKLDSDAYLIDFRLFRSCDMKSKLSNNGNNLNITFSPKSLENRSKNEKFDITVDIKDFRSFISSEAYKTQEDINNYLNEKCLKRKSTVNKLKINFTNKINTFTEKKKELSELNSKLNKHLSELENVKTAVFDTDSQINDINSLKNSYQTQLKSIASLTNGTNKLISKESQKSVDLRKKEMDIGVLLNKKVDEIKIKEDEIIKEKENFHKLIENSKDIENSLIKEQKRLSEEENNLSSIYQNKMKLTYDLKNNKDNLKKIKNQENKLNKEIQNLITTSEEKKRSLFSINKQKAELNTSIELEKIEIENIQKQINDLILKKSKTEENLKSKYDLLNLKEDEISKIRIELDSNNSQMKNFENKKLNLEEKEEKTTISNINNIENQLKFINENYENSNKRLEKTKIRIDEINTKRQNNDKLTEENKENLNLKTRQYSLMQNERNDFEKRINDISIERKDKENKLRNLRSESNNYKGEISNINKSLNSANDNLETFTSILNDFKTKLEPLNKKHNELLENKQKLENSVKYLRKEIKEISNLIKKETPSATIMVDLAEDEAFNYANANANEDVLINDSKGNKEIKWRKLIENIIA